jgi:hypothetical protein
VKPSQVRVVNGSILQSVAELLQASWSIQGYEFHTDLKVLILQNFDMILGMDWLELHSPMKVHWTHKWLAIPYASKIVTLQGIIPGALDCCNIELVYISPPSPSEQIEPAIQQVLDQFQEVFEAPSEFPPRRLCDHKIPLILGVVLVSSKPYKYALALKDELERQVNDIL